jgi:DNA-binding MarR family transcriptional regulator
LLGEIEKRWEKRFGKPEIDGLRKSLRTVASQIPLELPECLPILEFGLFSGRGEYARRSADHQEDAADFPLPSLLSQVLLAFVIDFESESELSLAICANLLRVLDEKGVRLRDLPVLSGVSKESISMAMGILRKHHLVAVEADPGGSRAKIIRLTPQGRQAQESYLKLLDAVEAHWPKRFGDDTIRALRKSLEHLVGDATAERSPLFQGLEPPPGSWRAAMAKPSTLPHYPMVLHRGGFPDGS